MAKRNLEHAHIVDMPRDMVSGAARLGGVKVCGGAACGFSDASTSSSDAKERSASKRKLFIALLFCLVFMGVEVVGGVKANSLAILTDAAHLSSDVSTYAISLFSLWAAGWEATPRQSYGFLRVEILGALASMLTIWLLTGMLVFKAIDRFVHDCGEVQGFLMFVIASIALAVNIGMAVLLGHEHGHDHAHQGHDHNHSDHSENRSDHGHEDHDHSQNHSPGGDCHHEDSAKHIDEHHHLVHLSDLIVPLVRSNSLSAKSEPKQKKQWNINLQGAYLHALGDSIQSLGVVIGGGIIWYRPEWKIVDLICTLTFSVIVLYTTFTMLRNIMEVLMESTPCGIDAVEIEKGLCEMEEVVAIHELHIWAITAGKVSLGCHVRIKPEADDEMVLGKVTEYIRRKHNINHVTIQIERW